MTIKHRKFKLTDSRSKWVANRDTTLQGEPMRVNPRTADRYALALQKEVNKMHKDVSKQIKELFASSTAKESIQPVNVAMDASISSLARVLTNKLIAKWNKRFNTFGKEWTSSMMGMVESSSSKDLSKSLNKLSGGLTIKTDSISSRTRDIINASADQSTSLIKTIGSDYTAEVKQAVMRSITDSNSSFTELNTSIDSMLEGKYKTYKNKAKNTALDQTRKAYTSITESKMKDVGVDQYVWRHAGGSVKPRDYHRDVLNGQTFKLSDPPVIDLKTGVRGKPGDAINCKCYMVPVVKFG